jgi:protein-disulfide isomerase
VRTTLSTLAQLLANGLLVVCAVVTTVMVVQLRSRSTSVQSQAQRDLLVVSNWQPIFEEGRITGTKDQPASFVVFSDYECPACRALYQRLRPYLNPESPAISVVYRHLPLPSHRNSELAAVASECAGEQGQFERMHSVLFEAQTAFDLFTWSELARKASVQDLRRFEECMVTEHVRERVRADVSLARELGMVGTPSVIFRGGRVFTGVPTKALLDSVVRAAKAQKAPPG